MGGYGLVPSPAMNFSRALHMLETGELVNPMFKHSPNDEMCARLPHAAFPVDLGIVSYRLFFVSPEINRALDRVHTLGDLRAFSIGLGCGWLDVDILRRAGLDVVAVPDYACLFKMVSQGRFDLLSRGVNEVKGEYEHYRPLWEFEMNQRLGLYYKLPCFFFTDRDGGEAARRVQEGLEIAYRDGSLQKLWELEYRESLDFARLEDKVFFEIANLFLKTLDTGCERYFFRRPGHGREQARQGGP
ncbi:hypothetical protein [Desulfocurvus sp. DL9XJH121]